MSEEKIEEVKMFTLPVALVQRILNYLQTKPYQEVANIIRDILENNPK